jgi:hypothetical protein
MTPTMATSFNPAIPSDPALFAGLTRDERDILVAHLTSGWYKQDAVYPVLSLAWWETSALLDDLHQSRKLARPVRGMA